MKNRLGSVGLFGTAVLGVGLLLGTVAAFAQDAPQTTPPADRTEKQEDTQHAMHTWDEFLGQHPELREQLNKDHNLVNDPGFQAKHPELQEFMQSHPGIARGMKKNPEAMMKRSRHYARSHHAGERHPHNDPDKK